MLTSAFIMTALGRLRGRDGNMKARPRLRWAASLLASMRRTEFVANSSQMAYPPFDAELHDFLAAGYASDYVRYSAIALAINRLQKDGIAGSFAEVGVYQGNTSRMIHRFAPERKLYLFDTFEGFPTEDLEGSDDRFKDTSVEAMQTILGDLDNVVIRKGYFPETARGLEDETFAFVMLDLDLKKPTLAGLQFFYPRMRPGGYIFAHDYNSPESGWAVSRAVDEFMRDKPEKLIEIPDEWGSIVFRKI